MFTSCFSRVKLLPDELEPVAISVGIPVWYKGRRDLRLAPTRAMLKMPAAEYNRLFAAILAQLNPKEVYESLGDSAVLLCWEKPGIRCHRLTVADWFLYHTGEYVPEWEPEAA